MCFVLDSPALFVWMIALSIVKLFVSSASDIDSDFRGSHTENRCDINSLELNISPKNALCLHVARHAMFLLF